MYKNQKYTPLTHTLPTPSSREREMWHNLCFIIEPSAPPANVRTHNTNSTSIFVQWDQVPEVDQNGVILSYTVTYRALPSGSSQTKNVTAPTRQATLTGLNEYTNYSITVFASTSKGGGNQSTPIVVITDEDSKFVITEFAYRFVRALYWYHSLLSQSPLSLVWSCHDKVIIQAVFAVLVLLWYSTICNCCSLIFTLYMLQLINSKMCFVICLTCLCSNCIFFFANQCFQLLQCVRIFQRIWWLIILISNNCFLIGPNAFPANVSGRATNSTSILVRWGEVPFPDQNGVILSYTVTYRALSSNSSKAKNVTAPANQTTLTGLNEYTNYSITVFASTSKGGGIQSTPIVVITDEDSKFLITEYAYRFLF